MTTCISVTSVVVTLSCVDVIWIEGTGRVSVDVVGVSEVDVACSSVLSKYNYLLNVRILHLFKINVHKK